MDATAQGEYEIYPNFWNDGKVELRRTDTSGVFSVNYSTGGGATLDTDYTLWGPVVGADGQINLAKLAGRERSGDVRRRAGRHLGLGLPDLERR